jgi:uncharacterized protein YhfF
MAWWSDLPRDCFGDSSEMQDELAALVVAGRKRATCGALSWYQRQPQQPAEGTRWVVEDGAGDPRCVVETTALHVCRFDEVTAEFAAEEGEGDLTLDWWRKAHRAFFIREGTFAPDMKVLCERFRLVEVIRSETAQ